MTADTKIGWTDRITLSRSRGWRMPEGAVKVDRSTNWGNPFTIDSTLDRATMVARHRAWLGGEGPDILGAGHRVFNRRWVLDHLPELAGRTLACWCKAGPCHADTLGEMVVEHAKEKADGGSLR